MIGKLLIKLTFAAALAAGLSSCYKEDMSMCPPVMPDRNVHLTLTLDAEVITRAGTGTRLARFDISGVRVWAFDKEGRMALYAAVPYDPDGVYDIYMNLTPGEYDFVVWTGDGSAYKITSEAELMRVMNIHLDAGDGIITDNIPDLLYGTARDCTVTAGVENHVEVKMRPNTYNVSVTADGVARSGERWEVAIDVDHIHYTFDNNIITTEGDLHHVRQGELNGGSAFTAPIRTLTISPDRYMQLTVRNVTTGQLYFDESLTQTIIDTYAANGQTPDFDRVYDYDIRMVFTPSPADGKMAVSISINGWQYNPMPTDLG